MAVTLVVRTALAFGRWAETLDRFPLFPLGLVLLPHELVPLHIFEERYKLMIGECLERDSQFGIVWLSDDGLKEIGCCARVGEVLERFEDGRADILAEGTDPFRLLRRIDDMPYPAGEIELLGDEEAGDLGGGRRGRAAPLLGPDPRGDRGGARPRRSSPPSTPTPWRPRSTWPSRQSRCCSSCVPSAAASSSSRGCSQRRSTASATPSERPSAPRATATCS